MREPHKPTGSCRHWTSPQLPQPRCWRSWPVLAQTLTRQAQGRCRHACQPTSSPQSWMWMHWRLHGQVSFLHFHALGLTL